MNGSPIDPLPSPPNPDVLRTPDADPPEVRQRPASPQSPTNSPYTPSSFDELNQILYQSIDQPAPDPLLEGDGPGRAVDEANPNSLSARRPGTGEVVIASLNVLGAVLPTVPTTSFPELNLVTPESRGELDLGSVGSQDSRQSGGTLRGNGLAASRHEMNSDGEAPAVSWSNVLIGSYASAVTLALFWLLWIGQRPHHETGSLPRTPREAAGASALGQAGEKAAPPLPAANMTILTRTITVGDLELTPLSIARRPVELFRLVEPDGEQRQSPCVLVLALKLVNRSKGSAFAPLDQSSVRETGPAHDSSYIEVREGKPISLLPLAPESEWAVRGQEFRELGANEELETIVASEPVEMARLKGPLSWHLKLRTAPYRTEVVGVRFEPSDVDDACP